MLKKVFKDKRAILAASFLALFSLVILASAVRNFTFRPARRLSHDESEFVRVPVGEILKSVADIPLERLIAFIVTLFLLAVLVVALLPPALRKKLFKQLFRLVLGILLLLYLFKIKPDLLQGLFPIFNGGAGQSAPVAEGNFPTPTFEPPQVSNWVSFFVTFGILLLAAFVFWRFNRWWILHKLTADAPNPLEEIAKAARVSLRNLSADGSAQDKIIQCYADMSRVVDVRRGLYREYAMTPAEFAVRLETAGLPREPVNRLTRLFESVRYGARTSVQSDVDEAIACLTSILKYCGESV
jgi:ABC-type multidrug transport system fused ATPase/permease subunit